MNMIDLFWVELEFCHQGFSPILLHREHLVAIIFIGMRNDTEWFYLIVSI